MKKASLLWLRAIGAFLAALLTSFLAYGMVVAIALCIDFGSAEECLTTPTIVLPLLVFAAMGIFYWMYLFSLWRKHRAVARAEAD